jgi:hypothetical protein
VTQPNIHVGAGALPWLLPKMWGGMFVLSRVLQATYLRTVLCKGSQYLNAILVKYPGVECDLVLVCREIEKLKLNEMTCEEAVVEAAKL